MDTNNWKSHNYYIISQILSIKFVFNVRLQAEWEGAVAMVSKMSNCSEKTGISIENCMTFSLLVTVFKGLLFGASASRKRDKAILTTYSNSTHKIMSKLKY